MNRIDCRLNRCPRSKGTAGLIGLLLALSTACQPSGPGTSPELDRELATRLQSVGVHLEAARYFERYLEHTDAPPEKKAAVALTLARLLKDEGQLERALAWLYRLEQWAPGSPTAKEAAPLIVACLDRLGKSTAAQTALKSRASLSAEASSSGSGEEGALSALALIDGKPFTQADFDRALETLPKEAQARLSDPAQRRAFLEQLVARELLYGKAVTRGLDKDPQVRQQAEAMLREITISRLLETELKDKVRPAESDLRNFYEAQKERFKGPDGTIPAYEAIQQQVGQAYVMSRVQSLSQEMLQEALAAKEVQLFPEALEGGVTGSAGSKTSPSGSPTAAQGPSPSSQTPVSPGSLATPVKPNPGGGP